MRAPTELKQAARGEVALIAELFDENHLGERILVRHRAVLTLLLTAIGLNSLMHRPAAGNTLDLDFVADDSSSFFELFSGGFYRMDLESPPPNDANQSFHEIGNPSNIFNQAFDGFPNDRDFRFGSLVYDDATLLNGNGVANITELDLGIAVDPDDPGHVNSARWADGTVTEVDSFYGTVALTGGVVTSVELTSEIRLVVTNIGGSTIAGHYPGSFTMSGRQFALNVTGAPEIDVFGRTPAQPFPLTWEFSGMLAAELLGDFNADSTLDVVDIDLLTAEVLAATNTVAFDLNDDQIVDNVDRTIWVNDLRRTYLGDANLDSEFGSGDLVQVLAAGKYETRAMAGWAEGDWNGDGWFDTGDLISAFAGGGYELGPRAAVVAVPEPSAVLLMVLGIGTLTVARRRVRSHGVEMWRAAE
jgi:hypothetical protein